MTPWVPPHHLTDKEARSKLASAYTELAAFDSLVLGEGEHHDDTSSWLVFARDSKGGAADPVGRVRVTYAQGPSTMTTFYGEVFSFPFEFPPYDLEITARDFQSVMVHMGIEAARKRLRGKKDS